MARTGESVKVPVVVAGEDVPCADHGGDDDAGQLQRSERDDIAGRDEHHGAHDRSRDSGHRVDEQEADRARLADEEPT